MRRQVRQKPLIREYFQLETNGDRTKTTIRPSSTSAFTSETGEFFLSSGQHDHTLLGKEIWIVLSDHKTPAALSKKWPMPFTATTRLSGAIYGCVQLAPTTPSTHNKGCTIQTSGCDCHLVAPCLLQKRILNMSRRIAPYDTFLIRPFCLSPPH